MSLEMGNLCSAILQQYFGDHVQKVGDSLFSAVQSRTLSMIIKSTNLTKNEVANALAIMLKFRLIKFEPSSTGTFAEYSINRENILLLLRYPRYVHLIQTKFGQAAASIIEELLRSGYQTATRLIAHCYDTKEKTSLTEHRDAFLDLCGSTYIFRAPIINNAEESSSATVPTFKVEEHNLFVAPNIDLQEVIHLKNNSASLSTDSVYWLVNTDRFHQDFRDSLMVSAIERKIDENAGECMKYIFQQMYVSTHPWHATSNPINFVDIKQLIERKSTNSHLIKYLDDYISIIIDDQLKMLIKFGDMGGGQYSIQLKYAIEQLVWACIENIISEKFGAKAKRIFRVVRFKGFIEQEDIQKDAMVPAKEAKLLTYKLLEEHFLQIKHIRKPGGGGAGLNKCFFLFYVNQQQIVNMLLETTYKALFNTLTRSSLNKSENKRLIEKSQRLESIIEAMKERGESEEYISEIFETLTPPEREILQKVKTRIKNLFSAEIGLDETIFLFQLYQSYKIVQQK